MIVGYQRPAGPKQVVRKARAAKRLAALSKKFTRQEGINGRGYNKTMALIEKGMS